MKRVLVMSIGTDLGGIERSMIDFLKYLVKCPGVQVDLYLWRSPGPLFGEIPPEVNVIDMPLGPCGLRECRTLRQFGQYAVFRLLDVFHIGTKCFERFPHEYDVAIAYCQVGYVPYYVIDKVRAARKYFFYHHGSYEERGLKRRVDGMYFGRFDNVITVSRANVKMLESYFPTLAGRILASGILLDEEAITKAARRDDEAITPEMAAVPLLVTVARMSEEKGVDIAIDAAKVLSGGGYSFRWVFVGSGPAAAMYQRRIDEAGLGDCCILLGRRSNPYSVIARAAIYVQPSRVESYSITIREAAILHKPIVATALPAIEEAREELAGLRTVPPDPGALASELTVLLSDSEGLAAGRYNTCFRAPVNSSVAGRLSQILNLNI